MMIFQEKRNMRSIILIVWCGSFFLYAQAIASEQNPFVQPEGCDLPPFSAVESCSPFPKGKYRSQGPLKTFGSPSKEVRETFVIPAGNEFSVLTSELHTIKAATYQLTAQDIREGKCEDQSQLKAGDKVYVLSYSGEGYYEVWHDSKIFSCSFHSNSEKIDGQFQTEEWLNIDYNGQKGWLPAPDMSSSSLVKEEATS